jgi:hypothetical protein
MTAQSEALAAKLGILNAIGSKDLQYPSMPMDTFLQEARYLYKWAGADRDALLAAGLDWSLVEDLPVRADAASEAQSEWHNVRFGREEAQQQWALLSPAGYALRDEILHYMRYAYRALPELQTRVSVVAEGSSDSDMIQDLNDLAVIGRENLQPLLAVGFDAAKLDEAASKSRELAGLRADASVDKRADRERKLLRDRAYTHLKQAVDEVRRCGQFVFWKNDERLVGYASEYLRKNRQRAEAKAATEAPSAQ